MIVVIGKCITVTTSAWHTSICKCITILPQKSCTSIDTPCWMNWAHMKSSDQCLPFPLDHCMLSCFCYLSIFVGATFFCICNFHIFTWMVICQAQLVIYFMLKYAMEILLSESSVVTTYYFSWSTSAVAIFLAILGLTVLPVNAIVGSYITNLFEDR